MNRLVGFLIVGLFCQTAFGASVGGNQDPNGVYLQCPLPVDMRAKNVGGSDGAGLCVFTSIQYAALYQDVFQLKEFQAWMRKHPGGGWPEKVDQMIDKLCKEKGWAKPRYIQNRNGDLALLELACRTGRPPSITYSFSPSGRYGGGKIAHMVSLFHAIGGFWGIADNNYPDEIEWLTTEEFKKTFGGIGGGWSVILLQPGPPKMLHN